MILPDGTAFRVALFPICYRAPTNSLRAHLYSPEQDLLALNKLLALVTRSIIFCSSYSFLYCHLILLTASQNLTYNMLPIRILSVAAVLIGSMMVTPAEAVSAHHVEPGNVYVAKPVHFEPQHVRLSSISYVLSVA